MVMATRTVRVRKSLPAQQDLREQREHCSVDPHALSAIGIATGQQLRVVRSNDVYALYTVSEVAPDDPNDVVRMGLTGRRRLDTDDEFDAELESQVVDPTMSDEEAEANGAYVERLSDDGANTALIAIAPHGGDIENHTDDQAQRVASRLVGKMDVSVWLCKGYQARGAKRTWHITSTDIDPTGFPLLGSIFSRGFTDAVAFHGFDREEILVGGLSSLKADVASEIEKTLAGSNIPVRIASSGDVFGGDDPANIVNRLTAGGANGVQIEQSLLARTEHWVEIADAVAKVYSSRTVRCHRLIARLIALVTEQIRTAVKQLSQCRRR
jgi:phage replication-related protein YjqB (UPF0714/DUF867 family)